MPLLTQIALNIVLPLLLLPYTGLVPFRGLKVQSKLVHLGTGGVSFKTVNKKTLIKLFCGPLVIKKSIIMMYIDISP